SGEGGNLHNAGLGAAGRRAINAQNGPILWATVLATVGLGVIGLGLISIIERTLLPRRRSRAHNRAPFVRRTQDAPARPRARRSRGDVHSQFVQSLERQLARGID